MGSEEVLQRMIDAGIVESNDGEVSPTAEFESRRSEIRATEADQGAPEWLAAAQVDPERLGDESFVANAMAVAEFADGMDDSTAVVAATALERLVDPPRATGAPEGFAPLRQEDLCGFLAEHRASVIFVWTPGNPTCERMADALGRLHGLSTVDGTIGLGSICVEDGAELLRKKYDVALLPTTLYFVGQSVDARAIGPRDFDHVRREVETIAAQTSEYAPTNS